MALDEIFFQQKYADKVIEKLFKANRKWGARDRKFFAETLYEIVRHKRRLSYLVGDSEEPWDLIGAHLLLVQNSLPDWPEWEHLDHRQILSRKDSKPRPAILYSFPDWLYQLGDKEFGDEWPALMKSLNQQAEVYLRANALKIEAKDLVAELVKEDIQAELVSKPDFKLDHCVKLSQRKNVFITNAFKKGLFEVQDAASQLVAPLLDIKPGLRVVDACAGAGGKSLHIASLMKNKGKLIAMDIHEWKLKELKTRAARNGVDIIETKVIESTKTIKRMEDSFDRVLLDVPCSGMGVLRRNPDTKWKLSLEEIERLQNLQKEILSSYSNMCKKDGLMVYATCSILHRENEEQVRWFLDGVGRGKWELVKELRVWPHRDGFDGFYAAVMKKIS